MGGGLRAPVCIVHCGGGVWGKSAEALGKILGCAVSASPRRFRGSVAAIAREVENFLAEKGYKVRTQDYDIPITANFIEEMHEAVKNSRDLVVLFTRDYEHSPYTRMEFTSFEANAAQSVEKRRMVILRCEDAPLLGLFAPHV
jgi:hypothetical protein